ncbi:MAG: hypothetical protein Q7S43_03250, partial [bacterium]|nr:hypothetical protein [bacterium]MDO8496445.1 hypothetical protein [bacterium]
MKEGKSILKLRGLYILRTFVVVLLCFGLLGIYLPGSAQAAVPQILSFQGRLTDASGNLLGGSGTNHYFKFDIYTVSSGGSSAWSSGASVITIKVTQGVFNTLLGDTSAGYSALSLDFDSRTYYLEVQVSDDNVDFETLTPRQRIVSSGFAINAETVHGGRFLNTSGVGQFGATATVAYSRFGTDTTSHAGTIDASNDLLISGGLEVNGSTAFDGFVIFGNNASVSGNLELGSSSKFGLNSGLVTDTNFEIGGTASISGAFTFGNNSATGAIDTNDWDISAAGALTGISFDANGSGNSVSNIDSADLTADTLDFTSFSDTSALDANWQINRAGFFIGVGSAPSTVFEVQGTASASYLLTGNTIQVGGFASAAYSRFGTDATSHAGTISGTNDLLITGGLEVNGSVAFDGFTLLNSNASVSGNFEVTGTGSSSFAGSINVAKGLTTNSFQ